MHTPSASIRMIWTLALTLFLPWNPKAQPNLLLILADDLGWNDLSCYGSDLHETPHLDRFASQGLRFLNAYAAAPVCSPTRASLLTGRSPARLHMTIWHESAINTVFNRSLIPPNAQPNLPLTEITLAEILREKGYYSGHIGKWHLGEAGYYPENQGFDVNIAGTFWGAPQTFFHPFRGNQHYGGEPRYVPGLEPGHAGDYLTDRLTDKALEFLDQAHTRPFYLNLWYHSVHTPIESKASYRESFIEKSKTTQVHRNPSYAGMVKSLDENVGRVLAKLDELGIAQNTLVCFLSDNGATIGKWEGETIGNNSPLRSGKGALYEGGIRIPWIVRWEGKIPANLTSSIPISTCDFLPTITAMMGIQGTPQVDGMDLSTHFLNPSHAIPNRDHFWHYPHYYPTTSPVSAMVSDGWKLLYFYEDKRWELYHLASDPSESKELGGLYPGRLKVLQERLKSWLNEQNAQVPTPNTAGSAPPSK